MSGPGVWAELLADGEIERALPSLAAVSARVGLALSAERIGDANVAALTRRAANSGVGMRAWLLLPRAHGYWVGESNAGEFVAALERLWRWIDERGGPAFDGVSVDLEPAFDYAETLRTTQKSRPDRWLSLLAEHVNPASFERARDCLARGVDQARRRRLHLHAVTYPLVLDQTDGDVTIEDAFDIPVSGIDWDEVSVMVYQTAYAQQLGLWLGADLVHSYARSAVERYGDRAGVDVGVVGDAGLGLEPGDRYPTPDALWADIDAAVAAGIPLARLRVYGLAGMLGAGGVERWLGGRSPRARMPQPSAEVRGVRNAARAIAAALRALR